MREFYQYLYDHTDYNWKNTNRCPGIKWYPYYKKWLIGYIFDFGCGNGGTVRFLKKEGYTANGMDWVNLNNGMFVGDITKKQSIICDTALCIDVMEHINDDGVNQLANNMKNAKHVIINVSNTPSPVEGKELHINIKSFKNWEKIINNYFKISEKIETRKGNMLYLCE